MLQYRRGLAQIISSLVSHPSGIQVVVGIFSQVLHIKMNNWSIELVDLQSYDQYRIYLNQVDTASLILDELGAGTDPQEGAYCHPRRPMLSGTHHGNNPLTSQRPSMGLRLWVQMPAWSLTQQVCNSTYQAMQGVPGSNAFETSAVWACLDWLHAMKMTNTDTMSIKLKIGGVQTLYRERLDTIQEVEQENFKFNVLFENSITNWTRSRGTSSWSGAMETNQDSLRL